MNILLDLFLTFAKIGLFTFGGGYAMISMIENNCVERKNKYVQAVLRGLKPCVIGIVLATGIYMVLPGLRGKPLSLPCGIACCGWSHLGLRAEPWQYRTVRSVHHSVFGIRPGRGQRERFRRCTFR